MLLGDLGRLFSLPSSTECLLNPKVVCQYQEFAAGNVIKMSGEIFGMIRATLNILNQGPHAIINLLKHDHFDEPTGLQVLKVVDHETAVKAVNLETAAGRVYCAVQGDLFIVNYENV